MTKNAKRESDIVSKAGIVWTFVGLIVILLLLMGMSSCGPKAGSATSASPAAAQTSSTS